jgi:hypothetical protein
MMGAAAVELIHRRENALHAAIQAGSGQTDARAQAGAPATKKDEGAS